MLRRRGRGPKVRGRYSRVYCGRGSLRRCRKLLRRTLLDAYGSDPLKVYTDKQCQAGDQVCFDAVAHRPFGLVEQPLIHWINRPTFQQVVEVQGQVPR